MATNQSIQNISILSRIKGSLIGVLCGDAYGALFEHSTKDVSALSILDHINKYRSSGKDSDGSNDVLRYTDDTAMTKATCRSLIEMRGINPSNLAKKYAECFLEEPNRGYGQAVKFVFKQLLDTNYSDPYGPASKQFDGQGSYGNGAAMRIVPVAIYSYLNKMNSDEAIEVVNQCSKITHSNVDAILGASLIALSIRYLLALKNDVFDETLYLNFLIRNIEQLEGKDGHFKEKIKIIQTTLSDISVKGSSVSQSQIASILGNDVSAFGSVPLAIFSFLFGVSKFTDSYRIENEFVRTMHWAISCGGDTDTIASMACALTGAFLGIEKIPDDVYSKCEDFDEILLLAEELASLDKSIIQ